MPIYTCVTFLGKNLYYTMFKQNYCQNDSTFKSQNAKLNPIKKKFKNESSSEISIPTNSESESDSTEINNELKTPDYTSYDEESLHSDDELLVSKIMVPLPESKKYLCPDIPLESQINTNIQNSIYTGYKLWSCQMKKEIIKKYPSIDVTIMTVRLGEMWTQLSIRDRNNWHFKAQKLTKKAALFDCEKQKWVTSSNNQLEELKQHNNESQFQNVQVQPINVAAHLKLLGESLIIIGARIKLINKPVKLSDYVTVLLDSLLCAIGSLICLTQKLWIFRKENTVTFLKTIANIAYIIPGL